MFQGFYFTEGQGICPVRHSNTPCLGNNKDTKINLQRNNSLVETTGKKKKAKLNYQPTNSFRGLSICVSLHTQI